MLLSLSSVQTGEEMTPTLFLSQHSFLSSSLPLPWVPTAFTFLLPCAKAPISPLSLGSLFQFSLSLSFHSLRTWAGKATQAETRGFIWSETKVSLSWLLPVSCWGSAAVCLQQFTRNIFHYISHFYLNLFIVRFEVKTAGILYSLSSSIGSFCQLLQKD